MDYWKSKVLPKIKKVFEKNGAKKAAAAEATKSFDDSKEEINKEFEEKKTELGPKVLEIYEASSVEIKTLVKGRKEAGLKKQSAAVNKILEELVKIEFPGSKLASEASTKFGPALVSGPVFFVFEKVSIFLPVEEEEPKTATDAPPPAEAAAEESSSKEKEIVSEKEKKEEVAKEEEKTPEAAPATSTAEETTTPAPAPAPEPAKEETPKA